MERESITIQNLQKLNKIQHFFDGQLEMQMMPDTPLHLTRRVFTDDVYIVNALQSNEFTVFDFFPNN